MKIVSSGVCQETLIPAHHQCIVNLAIIRDDNLTLASTVSPVLKRRRIRIGVSDAPLERFNKTSALPELNRDIIKRAVPSFCRWGNCDARLASEWHLAKHVELRKHIEDGKVEEVNTGGLFMQIATVIDMIYPHRTATKRSGNVHGKVASIFTGIQHRHYATMSTPSMWRIGWHVLTKAVGNGATR